MIHRDILNDTYHAMEGISNSMLGHMARSPWHYRHAIANPQKQTPAMLEGQLLHSLVLEPETASALYAVAPKFDRRTKQGKADAEAFDSMNAGKIIVTADQYEQATAWADALMANKAFAALHRQITDVELSILSLDEPTGLMRRGRIDAVIPAMNVLLDVKTTVDASFDGFSRAIANYAYHRQAAYYIDLARAEGMDVEHFVFACVEKETGATAIWELDAEDIEAGRREWRRLLNMVAMCESSGEWPGYSEWVGTIARPSWARRNDVIEQEIL
jgi:hypothetical protein